MSASGPNNSAPSAVVFAYHNVGVRLLKVLIDAGVQIRLVVTHADNCLLYTSPSPRDS